jgi:cation diffusion facilitator family transporter
VSVLDPVEVGRDVRRVLWITLGLNVLVSASKIVVGHLSQSQAMVADGYHSLMDGANNVVGLVVAAFAHRPPDAGHPYGHRKFESAAAILIGLALLALAWEVGVQALAHLGNPRLPDITVLNWVVMAGTLLVNVLVTRYEKAEARRLGSDYLMADAAHTRSDVYVTLGVVASFAGTRAGLPAADPLIAGAIAAFIATMGAQVLLGSFHALTDRAVITPEDLEFVVLKNPRVRSCTGIRTRGTADHVYVDLTIRLDGELTLQAAHDVADQIEASLMKSHPQIVDVVVHLEPE